MLLEAFRSVGSEIEEALRDRGIAELTSGQATALLLIDRTGTRLGELAHRGQVSKQAMMQVVDGLASLGCVRRGPDPNDGRAKVVKLTAKGLRYRAEARRVVGAVEGRVKRRLGDRRYEAMRTALAELAEGE